MNTSKGTIAILSLALFIVMLGYGMAIPLFPFYVAEMGAGGQQLGLLIAISASSVTPYVLGALEGARTGGARTMLVTCAPTVEDPTVADLVLALATGPEVLTGSTRLKAASATKAVLNAITTSAMVRLGKVYGNYMVDLRPGSAKLRDRALRMIEAAGAYREAGLSDDPDALIRGLRQDVVEMNNRGVSLIKQRAQLDKLLGVADHRIEHLDRSVHTGAGQRPGLRAQEFRMRQQ